VTPPSAKLRHRWPLAERSFHADDILRTLLESTTCGSLLVDRDHRILLSNTVFDDTLGIPRGTAVGSPGAAVLSCPGLSTNRRRCTAADPCIACATWNITDRAFHENRELKSSLRVEVETPAVVHVVEVGVRAATLRLEHERFVILIFEGLNRLREFRCWAEEGGMHGILGSEPKMLELFETIRRVAPSDAPVLIRGESGSGKDLVATAVHRESARKDGPMVPVNCGALSPGVVESELFGHVEGAFTGALRDKKGRFELAHGGTIFLDEVGELSLELQVKLLRVLQSGRLERVGGERTVSTDARVICATNQDLEQAVADRTFRADLFYRLCVVPVTVPPLRERPRDIPLLSERLLAKAAEEYGQEVPDVSPELSDALSAYPWPGNVRELENALRHALVTSGGTTLQPAHLPKPILEHAGRRLGNPAKHSALDDATVSRALRVAEGNRTRAARVLGVSRATLYRYLAQRQQRQGDRGRAG